MASRVDNLASNLSLANFSKATELKNRIWFTVGALVVFRFLSFVPLPGVNPLILETLYQQTKGGILDLFNTFSGGALEHMSLISLGVMPYITASIVIQLAASLHPSLMALKKEGEAGRKKLNQYTRYGTVLLCAIQGWFLAVGLEAYGASSGAQAVVNPGYLFRVTAVVNLIGGSMFLLWLGEQITSRGIGNGVSLIIMAGIISRFPTFATNLFEGGRTGSISPFTIVTVIGTIVVLIVFICFMERAQRRLLIQYPKRASARGMMQADRSHLPLKLNTANVIPPIFASSLLLMPLTVLQMAGARSASADSAESDWLITVSTFLQHGSPAFNLLYALGIIFFTFFYTSVQFNSEETAENLKRHGGFIPGIRPGKATEHYFDYLLNRITVVGAAYLTVICLIPEILSAQAGLNFRLGGTSLLIVVNVTMDTVSQIQSHLIAHQYGDLIKKAKLKTTPRRR
jgi:preprotein translocase subunit SecY